MVTDPIADLLTQIRNAGKARLKKVDVDSSQMKVAIVDLLMANGFVKSYKLYRDGKKGVLRVYLKYVGKGTHVIRGIQRVSKSSCRVYFPYRKIPKVLNGLGVSIISSSKGIMTDQMAREHRIGGEVLCTVW